MRSLMSLLRKRSPRGSRRTKPIQCRAKRYLENLEDRCLLAIVVPIPTSNPVVELSTIFWNGEKEPLNPDGKGKLNIPAPYEVGAAKTITIINNSDDTIFPFLRGQNSGTDPNSSNKGPYDPQDLVNHEFREYIGYSKDGSNYLGLPKEASITVQVPLVLWDGNNLYIATDGTNLTTPSIFGYDATAKITIADSNTKHSGTIWVTASSNFPDGKSPLAMFYFSNLAPVTVPTAAPAQLTEVTFRDPYLTHFIDDPNQTFPLLNYDVSYVNNLVAPVAMAASHVPITYQINPDPPPHYFGYEDFGWLATASDTKTFQDAIDKFTKNAGNASIGNYFPDRQGWPEYYNPNPKDFNIPAGSNLFAESPLNAMGTQLVHTSSYDSNRWLLTSSGDAPIQAGGAGVGQQGFVRDGMTDRIYLNNPSKVFSSDLKAMLKEGVVNVFFPGSSEVLAKVIDYTPNSKEGMPYVTLDKSITPTGDAGKIFAFIRPATDYAITAITNLWFSWAQYYVEQYKNFAPESIQATLHLNDKDKLTNEIILDSAPQVPLAPGMKVAATGIPAGTTILRVEGNHVFLTQIPNDGTPSTQQYTFSKPEAIPYDPKYTTPFSPPLQFSDEEAPNAKLFAGSVYTAMAAESVGLPPSPYLPFAMNLVSQVIQFYAKIPGFDKPTGPALVGQVRDVVKSILRGVYDFNKVPDQTQWYPDPKKQTGGQKFNVYNLDPYVWFVHRVLGMSAYGFSVDDDVANPTATGPLLGPDSAPNHFPNNLQIGFGGTGGFGNTKQWFPTTPWGGFTTMATIHIQPDGEFKGRAVLKFEGPMEEALKLYNQINNPGTGEVGAYVFAPEYIVPGTTLVHKGPTSGLIPEIVLSQNAISTDTPIQVKIQAGSLNVSKVSVGNAGFELPRQSSPPFYTVNPKSNNVDWDFTGTAGIAGSGSIYTQHNPAPLGTQVGFIENVGSIRQTVRLTANGAYAVSFLVAQRLLDDGSLNAQTLEVRIDDTVIGAFKPTDSNYLLFTSDAFTVKKGGKHTITITGTNLMGGDNTALIDEVTVTGPRELAPTSRAEEHMVFVPSPIVVRNRPSVVPRRRLDFAPRSVDLLFRIFGASERGREDDPTTKGFQRARNTNGTDKTFESAMDRILTSLDAVWIA